MKNLFVFNFLQKYDFVFIKIMQGIWDGNSKIQQFRRIKRRLADSDIPLNERIKLVEELTKLTHEILDNETRTSKYTKLSTILFPEWFK